MSLCEEEVVGMENGDLHCGEPGERSGTARGTAVVGCGCACTVANVPDLRSPAGHYLGLVCATRKWVKLTQLLTMLAVNHIRQIFESCNISNAFLKPCELAFKRVM